MLEAIFPLDAVPADDVAELCLTLAREEGHSVKPLLYGTPADLPAIRRAARARKHFGMTISELEFGWGGVANFDHSLLTAQKLSARAEERLLTGLAARAPMISARFYDREYDEWQNAFDPATFMYAGKSTEGLPMKNNGLPPPLNKMVVDTSHNPGRRVLRHGYVEAIAHRVWLGPEFFKRVPGASREAVLAATWLKTTQRPNGVLEILAHDEPFREGVATDVQERLRALLFPTDALSS